jgi:NAD(P)-dependent dehydrogenase (short-subunit alcohol dehydrogenase family)
MNNYNRLAGQVALVTGSGRGIGRATALALAQSGTAAAVALTARSADQLVAEVETIQQGGLYTLAISRLDEAKPA